MLGSRFLLFIEKMACMMMGRGGVPAASGDILSEK